jgi:hypothetical protein
MDANRLERRQLQPSARADVHGRSDQLPGRQGRAAADLGLCVSLRISFSVVRQRRFAHRLADEVPPDCERVQALE